MDWTSNHLRPTVLQDGGQALVMTAPEWMSALGERSTARFPDKAEVLLSELEAELGRALEAGQKTLVVDFTHTSFYGSHHSNYMGFLVKVADRFNSAGGSCRLAAPSASAVRIYSMIGLLPFFVLCATLEAALRGDALTAAEIEAIAERTS